MPPSPNFPLRIFLAEDNDDARLMLTRLLEAQGHLVRSAASVKGTLADPAAYDCQVLLADLGLPDGDGWALVRALRRTGAVPYAIAMSGFGMPSDVAASVAAGFAHHLVKPIDIDALDRLLELAGRRIAAGPDRPQGLRG